MITVYLAQAMTFEKRTDLVETATIAVQTLACFGIKGLSPVIEEGVTAADEPLTQLSDSDLEGKWRMDKRLIRESHVILDLSGYSISEGVRHEIGYARYALFMPVVRIFPKLGPSVARIEDDLICTNLVEAAQLIEQNYGTRWKRIKWRLKNFIPLKWPKLMFRQFVGMFR